MTKLDFSQIFENCGDGWNWGNGLCEKCIYYDESDKEITPDDEPYVVICTYGDESDK